MRGNDGGGVMLNKVMLIGRLGKDPETHGTQSGGRAGRRIR